MQSQFQWIPQYTVISQQKPTQTEIDQSAILEQFLISRGCYLSAEEANRREQIISKLKTVVKDWAIEICKKQLLSDFITEELTRGICLQPFGSQALGVSNSNSDLDLLCIVPKNIKPKDFFSMEYGLYNKLLQLNRNNHEYNSVSVENLKATMNSTITNKLTVVNELKTDSELNVVDELQVINDAYVPIITMKFNGVSVDILIASLDKVAIPDCFNVLEEINLRNISEQCQRGLNGPRVVGEILSLVPNIESFRTTLRAVKFWAKRRKIYGNTFGYLNGVSCAILVAKTCCAFPTATPITLLQKFFKIFHLWNCREPICLTSVNEGQLGLGFRVWNPNLYKADRYQFMPILTPSYPSMNCMYNVSKSTMNIMKNEITRGFNLFQDITKWTEIFNENIFFNNHKHFIEISLVAENEIDLKQWSSFVESKIRLLILKLEQIQDISLFPLPCFFTAPNSNKCHQSMLYIGIDICGSKKMFNFVNPIVEFNNTLNQWNRKKDTMHLPIVKHLKRKQIPHFVFSRGPPRKRKLENCGCEDAPNTKPKKMKI